MIVSNETGGVMVSKQRQVPGRLIAELYQTSEEELRPSLTIPQNWKGRNASKLTTRSYCHSDGKTG